MRDIDVGLRVTLVARKDAGIKALDDLPGKRVIIGRQTYQEGMLSNHFLKKSVDDFEKVQIVQLARKNAKGQRADTSARMLEALAAGQGDAALVPLGFWNNSSTWRKQHPGIRQIWKSPEFNHCVFTAAKDFDSTLGKRFT